MGRRSDRWIGGAILASACLALLPSAARTQETSKAEVQLLRAEVERLKAEQAARMAETRRLEERLAAVEATLRESPESRAVAPAAVVASAAVTPAASQAAPAPSKLKLASDLRLRYEGNWGDADGRDWSRGVLRARFRADYAASDWLSVGAQLATGDPDDPNSTDVTLSNFLDDLSVSLDMAYAKARLGAVDLWGGKFPLPFARSDLVWDGDVNPQGVAATVGIPFGDGSKVRLSGLYFLVDQSVAGPDSSMIGGQVGIDMPMTDGLRLELYAGAYDYTLSSVAGADAGDLRSNVIGPDGRYVSDFDLLDVVAGVTYTGFDTRWPLRIAGNYVHNTGARVSGDTGYGIEMSIGRAKSKGDWRIGYGYSMAEVDAVMVAFSHDNTTLASNYLQHSVYLDYTLLDNVVLDATLYHYRPKDPEFAGVNDPDDWLDRLRLNFLVSF